MKSKCCHTQVEVLFLLSGFSRLGSFRQATLTERLADPQSTKVVEPAANSASPSAVRPNIETAQVERPHASANLLLRQGSFNTFNKLNRCRRLSVLLLFTIEWELCYLCLCTLAVVLPVSWHSTGSAILFLVAP